MRTAGDHGEMTFLPETVCPRCGFRMPTRDRSAPTAYYNTSTGCMRLATEVLGDDCGNAFLFGPVH